MNSCNEAYSVLVLLHYHLEAVGHCIYRSSRSNILISYSDWATKFRLIWILEQVQSKLTKKCMISKYPEAAFGKIFVAGLYIIRTKPFQTKICCRPPHTNHNIKFDASTFTGQLSTKLLFAMLGNFRCYDLCKSFCSYHTVLKQDSKAKQHQEKKRADPVTWWGVPWKF